MARIDPSARVAGGARLADDVVVGPFCTIGPEVEIGEGAVLHSHVVLSGHTTIGPRATIHPFAVIGHPPQSLGYRDEPSRIVIGGDAIVREHVTINPGTTRGGLLTTIGDHCFLMAGAHVGHDCRVGDHVVFSNNVMLAGHCTVGNYAILGGGAAVIQFARVGDHAFVGGLSGLENDCIPYGMVLGNRAYLSGLNIIGLQRRGFAREDIHALRRAYRALFAPEGTLMERVEDVAAEYASHPAVGEILAFIREGGRRSICTPSEATASPV